MDCHENQPMLLCHCDHVSLPRRNRYLCDIEPFDAVVASVSRGEAPLKRRFSAVESSLLIDFCVSLLEIVFESRRGCLLASLGFFRDINPSVSS